MAERETFESDVLLTIMMGDSPIIEDHHGEVSSLSVPIRPHVVVLSLSEPDHWTQLFERFARRGNLRPWARCLGVLRGHKAQTVVIEPYYVCLDYKSEYAAFYAHLDAPRESWTQRLHFFSEPLNDDAVRDLSDAQLKSYLGYIVCRQGDLPVVGRCVLKVPSAYIQESTAVLEHVNLLGQTLTVQGVPFMQQDERFAVCAQVAAWVMHYSAHRRGITDRKLIADIVTMGGHLQPLRPHVSDGLTARQVANMLELSSFRTTIWHSPTSLGASEPIDLPVVTGWDMPAVVKDVADGVDDAINIDYAKQIAESSLAYSVTEAAERLVDGPSVETAAPHETALALHDLLDYLLTPYLRSGFPVYCGTADHALVICGRSVFGTRPMHFVHDDQNGPYLLAECLPNLSNWSLQYQAGLHDANRNRLASPEIDRLLNLEDTYADLRRPDAELGVSTFVIATPPRGLLSPSAANRSARQAFASIQESYEASDSDDPAFAELMRLPAATTVSLLMGIDYKRLRRQAVLDGDRVSADAYASVQLAEWVILVEGLDANGEVAWEFVYDASSSDEAPRTQFCRLNGTLVAVWPVHPHQPELSVAPTMRYHPLEVPLRVGKIAPDSAFAGDSGKEN